MSKLIIKCKNESFAVEGKDIINLELKLNITEYGRSWDHIGGYLFDFYNLNGYKNQPASELNVDSFQYTYLKNLNDRSYDEVYNEMLTNK